MRAELRPGAAVAYEGDDYDVEAVDGTLVRLRRRGPDRSAVVVAVECLLLAPGYRLLDVELPSTAVVGDPAAELLPEAHRARAEARLAHMLEARTGYRSGQAADAVPGEPRASYDPTATTMVERFATKAAELTAAGENVSPRTLHRWWSRWQELGLAGLVDARLTAQRKVLPSVDPRVRAEAERLVRKRSDGPTPAPAQLARHLRVAVEDAHGPDVRLPSRSVTQRLLHEVARGHATFRSGKRRREAANEPSTPFGSLRPSRPGQFVQYDSSPVNAFAYLPHTLEYQGLDLSVGLDVFSSSCVALRYTPIHAKAVDAVLLLRDTVTAKLARPGWPAEALWRYPGIPEAVLVTCLTGERHPKEPEDRIAGTPMVRPQAAVCDNGMIYLSLAFREGCATLGIDLQLARQGILRAARNDHAIVRWVTEVRADGVQPMAMLPGRWRLPDEGPRRVMAMAVKESLGACPKRVLRTTGRKPTLSLVHDAIDTFGLDEIVDLTGMDRIRLQRYRRGETWPSWDTQRQFQELLAADRGCQLT